MTYPAIDGSRSVAFRVRDREKADILREIRTGSSQVPAPRVRPLGQLYWFADRAAAGDGAR